MPRLGTDDDAHRNNTTNRRPLHIPVGSNSMATAYAANNHEPSSRLTGILFILAITFILKNVLFHQYALDETNNVQKMKHDIAYLLQAVQEVKDQLTVWKSSGTKFELLNGRFKYTVLINLYLGVIGSNKTWGYQSNYGNAYYWNDGRKVIKKYRSHNGSAFYWKDGRKVIKDLPKYTAGSVVHFVLDLTNEGTLRVSVDGSPSVQAFSNMKSLIVHDEGFLPATEMDGNNKIELLEFKSLPIDISS